MARQEPKRDQFEARRHKEQVAFLVVKFLRMFVAFQAIAAEFSARGGPGGLAGSGLFEKVLELSRGIGFDLKEMAHALFRNDARVGNSLDARPGTRGTRKLLHGMKSSIERRSIDSYIGTIYHLLLILQESLYQLERYTPELQMEAGEIERVLDMTRATSARIRDDEKEELARLQAQDEMGAKLAIESADLARQVMQRCETLLAGTAQMIRQFLGSASDNEILVLNLLQSQDLLAKVYGEGSAESIFSDLCSGAGKTGLARALAFARSRCGNVSALEAMSAS